MTTVKDKIATAPVVHLEPKEPPLVLDPNDPLPSARTLIERHYTVDGHRTLHHHNAEFFAWRETHYPAIHDFEIRTKVYEFLEAALRPGRSGDPVPYKPTSTKVTGCSTRPQNGPTA